MADFENSNIPTELPKGYIGYHQDVVFDDHFFTMPDLPSAALQTYFLFLKLGPIQSEFGEDYKKTKVYKTFVGARQYLVGIIRYQCVWLDYRSAIDLEFFELYREAFQCKSPIHSFVFWCLAEVPEAKE